jgi:hypothetical protein
VLLMYRLLVFAAVIICFGNGVMCILWDDVSATMLCLLCAYVILTNMPGKRVERSERTFAQRGDKFYADDLPIDPLTELTELEGEVCQKGKRNG